MLDHSWSKLVWSIAWRTTDDSVNHAKTEQESRELTGGAGATFDHRFDLVGASCVGVKQGSCRRGGEMIGAVACCRLCETRVGSGGFFVSKCVSLGWFIASEGWGRSVQLMLCWWQPDLAKTVAERGKVGLIGKREEIRRKREREEEEREKRKKRKRIFRVFETRIYTFLRFLNQDFVFTHLIVFFDI